MSKKYYEYVAIKIREARIRQGLTQADVADAIGKQRAAYAQYERGAAAIDMDVWTKIAKVLHLDLAKVMKEALEYEEAEQ